MNKVWNIENNVDVVPHQSTGINPETPKGS